MRNKPKWYSVVLLGLAFLLVSSSGGCFGLRIVDHEDDLQQYVGEVAPIMEEWKAVINDWEEAANNESRLVYLDLDAEECHDRMQTVISAWDAISPPDEAEEYHVWMGIAMGHEKDAFGVMAEYYRLGEYSSSEEFAQLQNQARELWILKDKALYKADDAAPKGLK
jgi:hypothetical protein